MEVAWYPKKRIRNEAVPEAEATHAGCLKEADSKYIDNLEEIATKATNDDVPSLSLIEEDESSLLDSSKDENSYDKFSIDCAKSGRAKCKNCKKLILKGVYRIGKAVQYKVGYIIQYSHIECIFKAFTKARSASNIIRDIDHLKGINTTPEEIKSQLKELIKNLEVNIKKLTERPTSITRTSVLQTTSVKSRISSLKASGLPSLKVMYTNADQLTSEKMTELKKHIESAKPHIVAICEVKRKKGELMCAVDYDIPGFTLHPLNLDNNIGRGVAIYTHSAIEKSVNQVVSFSKFEEACILEIRLRSGDVMLFGCVYRSPTETESSQENNQRLNRLLSTISKKKYSHICIVGDFNYKDINWNSSTTTNSDVSDDAKFLEAIKDSFLHQHVDKPTRRRGNDDPSLLDLVLTDEAMQVSEISHLAPLGKSDHSIMTFEYHCYIDYSKPKESHLYDKGDYNSMRNYLVDSKWAESFSICESDTTVESKWKELKDMLHQLRDRFVPLSKPTGKPNWVDNCSFPINADSRVLIKDKNKAFRNWMTCNTGDREHYRLIYTKARNKSKAALRNAKKNFEKGIAMSSKKNPKAFWKHIRRKLKTKPGVAPLLENERDVESIRYSDEEKANILQKQFASVFIREPAGEIPRLIRRTAATINYVEILEDMVEIELKKINPYKSCGPDEIHPRLLKELGKIIAGSLAFLFNLSIRKGSIPADWKLAFVSPIHKKGPKSIAENYRPISLTAILCKIMEKFIKSSILHHLLKNNLLSNRQFGFINGRSTVLQLLYYLDHCVNLVAEGGVIDAIYLDFSKAFDTVAHRRLIGKLEAYGIDGKLLEWIKSFLSGRSQTVKVNGSKSFPADVTSGIPQGSVLGPLLFVLYINDLLDGITSDGLLYADDAKIFRLISSSSDARKLQMDILKLEDWSKCWLLNFHLEKCHVLTLGKFDNIKHTERYTIYGDELEHVSEEKDLGVIFDSEMTFCEHITLKVKLANTIVGLIRRSFSYLDKQSFKKMYCAFVRTHLEYGQIIWSPSSRKYIDLIESVQMRATKLVDGLGNMDYTERLKALNLPTLAFRRLRGDMIELYNHFTKYQPEIITPSFRLKKHPSRQHKFQMQESRSKDGVRGVHSKSFYQRSASVWNSLPAFVINSDNINSFKNNLDEAWKHHDLRYNHKETSLSSD